MPANFASAIEAVMADYKEGLKRQIETPFFWDRTFGPPDRRPYYGPPNPVDTACGDISCRCCAHWRDQWDEHYCY